MGPRGRKSSAPCLLVPSKESKVQTCGLFLSVSLASIWRLCLPPSAELMQTGRALGSRALELAACPCPPQPGQETTNVLRKGRAQLLLTGEPS